jgi:2-keto-4-pentenoate hydratase/2-oxohepta-3-ene-1,7-dioic acid hydratase in catechol pathway
MVRSSPQLTDRIERFAERKIMRLASFAVDGRRRIGAVVGDGIIDLQRARPGLPADMIGLIENWPDFASTVREATQRETPHYALGFVHLLAPVPKPQKILAIGLNYADHIAETGREKPKAQTWFAKLGHAVNGPFDPIQMPKVSTSVDYEAELVFVIGRRCRHVAREDAADVVFGYCAGNDVSVRDWQYQSPQWILGKSFDTHAPFGPWIVTPDEIGDPHALDISCRVNGEIRQHSNTKELVFSVYDQIAHLSQAMTLEPGDVVFTGTPGGVGMARRPPSFLKAGDVVRVEIEKIGAIEARMVPEE